MHAQTLYHTALLPEIAGNPRRNGKIARLPKETRDMINRMIDDGLPYNVILDELGEAGQGINYQNLTNWKQGGYQDWLKNQQFADQTRVQTEAVMDLLNENPDFDPDLVIKACHLLGAVQLFAALKQQGPNAIHNLLQHNPEKYLSVLNLVCRVADTGLRYEQSTSNANALKELLSSLNQGESSQIKV